MKVSVIVPVYNSEKYLKKCLDSLCNQTLKDIEIICINDGSKDNSLKMLNEYKKNDSRIIIIDKENGGQASARNKGIDIAKGEFISFIDSDDYVKIDMLEKMYNKAYDENADLVVCDYYEGNEQNGFKKINAKNTTYTEKINFMFGNISPWNKLIKTCLIKNNNIKFLEQHIYEDLATMPLIGIYANKIVYIEEAFNYYIIRQGSTMRQKKYNRKLESIFVAVEHLKNEMIKRNFLPKYSDELEYIYIRHLLYAGGGRFLNYKEGIESFNKVIDIMKKKYPNWSKNKYFNKESKIFKITCRIFMLNNKFIIRLYNNLRNIVKGKE